MYAPIKPQPLGPFHLPEPSLISVSVKYVMHSVTYQISVKVYVNFCGIHEIINSVLSFVCEVNKIVLHEEIF
jgi:hypothetical protein